MTRSTIKGPQNGAITFNEDSADVDFRVESNGQTHALFVDAGNDHVNINTDTDLGGTLNVNGDIFVSNADAGLILTENANDANGSNLVLRKSRNTTLNAHTVVQDNDTLGSISFQGSDGDEFLTGTSLVSKVDYTPGNDDLGAKFEINISRDNAKTTAINTRFDSFVSTDSAKLQRTSVGYNVDTGSATSRSCGLHVGGHRYYHPAMVIDDYDSATSYATTLIQFYRNGSDCGEITATTSTTYSTSSDYRLKTDIQDMDSASETIKKLKPRKYKWKANENIDGYTNPHVNGFIAHEVQEAIPNANDMGIVTGTKDKMEEVENVVLDAKGDMAHLGVTEDKWKKGKADGTYASDTTWKAKHSKIKAQGIDYSRFTPILVKSLQEALARIDTLEAEVAKLKG